MKRSLRVALAVLGWAGVAAGCLDMETLDESLEQVDPVADTNRSVTWCPNTFAATLDTEGTLPDAGVGDMPMVLCGWENGWDDPDYWKSGVPKGAQTGWMKAVENKVEFGDGFSTAANSVLTNSLAILWSKTWAAQWEHWNFTPGFAYAGTITSVTCNHPTTRVGPALVSYCNAIATAVCQSPGNGDCCTSYWAPKCVSKARQLAANGGGNHPVTETGDPLPNKEPIFENLPATGDPGPGTAGARTPLAFGGGPFPGFQINQCAKKVCSDPAFQGCCSTAWSSPCVQRAITQCSALYLANPRVEQDRVMTDICVEATVPGYTVCPYKLRTSPSGHQECCHRAMVLQGVYQALDTELDAATHFPDANTGRYVEWYRKLQVVVGNQVQKVEATLVSDPCDPLPGGGHSCREDVSKLWEVAGPGRPLYPDCTTTPGGVRSCTCPQHFAIAPGMCMPSGAPHQGVELRRLLLAAASALITTKGHYNIDIRWALSSYPAWNDAQAPFSYNQSFNGHPVEAMWHASGGPWLYMHTFKTWTQNGYEAPAAVGANFRYWADPFCYSSNTPQRSGTLLSSKVEMCEAHSGVPLDQLPNPPLITTHWKPALLPPPDPPVSDFHP